MRIIYQEYLKGLRCYWCSSPFLYFDKHVHLDEPIGIRVSCTKCYMKGPIGKNYIDAVDKYRIGPKFKLNQHIKPILIRKEDNNEQ